ncbi:hypothetical protein [Parabacteroides sp. FAFU027]|uniref:hypothetical protein n=1 Tax=Parabacteroides sp. FAFU027 TaxID=2922715 RepID=UPI001FAF8FB3|nr:hypothetical protein [Parabacteroides sp. FAFU027]
MQLSFRSGLIPAMAFLLFLLSSCVKDEVTSIKLNNQQLSIKLGQTDSLEAVVSYSGEMNNAPVTISVGDSKILSASLSDTKRVQSGSSFSQRIVISSLAPGTTTVNISSGSRSITCTVTVTQTTLTMEQSLVINYGVASELFDNNICSMYLMPSSFTVDDSLGKISGTGQLVHLELLLSPSQLAPPATTFKASQVDIANTFQAGYYKTYNDQSIPMGSNMVDLSSGNVSYTLIKNGTLTVSINGSAYHIEGDLTTETREVIHITYSGTISVKDQREKPVSISPNFTKGELYYVGDLYNMDLSDTYVAYLETADVDLSSSTLNGEVLVLQFNTYQGFTSYIPTGTYRMMTKSALSSFMVKPLTLVPGYVYMPSDGVYYSRGSWYYDSDSRRKLTTGSVTVNWISGSNYQIDYTLYDPIGSTVSGSIKASLPLKSLRSAESNRFDSEAKTSKGFRSPIQFEYKALGK